MKFFLVTLAIWFMYLNKKKTPQSYKAFWIVLSGFHEGSVSPWNKDTEEEEDTYTLRI